jgi:propanediol utilization protein
MGIPVELFTPIFSCSRGAGWAAHFLEEKYPDTPDTKPVIYRPSAEYVGRFCGPLGCELPSLEQRTSSIKEMNFIKNLVVKEIQENHTSNLIPVSLSARHVHLIEEDFKRLFGEESSLHPLNRLSQPKEFAAVETVDLVGPKRAIYEVRILGPFRDKTQVEISRSDGYVLGVNPPTRQSGDLEGSPGLHLIGPKGAITLEQGVIFAARHIHISPEQARKLNVNDRQMVAVSFPGKRAGILDEIMVRVHPDYDLELHLDLDEGNALALNDGDRGTLITDLDQQAFSPFR